MNNRLNVQKKTFKFLIPILIGLLIVYSNQITAQGECLMNPNIRVLQTSLGSPLDGPFQPNEEITIEFSLEWYTINCNWLHGLIPTFGNGWSPTSFHPSGEPSIVQNKLNQGIGNFNWYENSEVLYNFVPSQEYSPGEPVPNGWYITATSPGLNTTCQNGAFNYDPNCSCGITQGCNNYAYYSTVMTLITRSEEECEIGLNDLKVSFKVFSDYETGSGLESPCFDLSPVVMNWAIDCTDPLTGPELLSTSFYGFSNNQVVINLEDYLMPSSNGEVSFLWEVDAIGTSLGATACGENCGSFINQQLENNSNEPLQATYTITAINSAGVAGTPAEFTVMVLPELVLITEVPENLCKNDCVTLAASATGGSNKYTFDWDALLDSDLTICPESDRSYGVTVTDEVGTSVSGTIEVKVLPLPMVNIIPQLLEPPCDAVLFPDYLSYEAFDQELEVVTWTGPGITAANQFDEIIYPEVPGVYVLRVRDVQTGCEREMSAFVTELVPEELTLATTESSVCRGTEPIDILSAEPAGGKWTGSVNDDGLFIPNIEGANVLTYTYQNMATGCEVSEELTIEVFAANLPSLEWESGIADQYCIGFSYEICIAPVVGVEQYEWQIENGTIVQVNDIGNCIGVMWNDTQVVPSICVEYQNVDGCLSKEICAENFNIVDADICAVGTDDLEQLDFSIFPNPVKNQISIQAEEPFNSVQIYNAYGQMVVEKNLLASNGLILPQLNLPSGVYFISLDRMNLTKFVVIR